MIEYLPRLLTWLSLQISNCLFSQAEAARFDALARKYEATERKHSATKAKYEALAARMEFERLRKENGMHVDEEDNDNNEGEKNNGSVVAE